MIPLHFNPLPVDQPTTAAAARTQAINRGERWYPHPVSRRTMSADVAASLTVCLHGEDLVEFCRMCDEEWPHISTWRPPQ